MILLIHNNKHPVEILKDGQPLDMYIQKQAVSAACFLLAEKFPKEFFVWVHQDLKGNLNIDFFKAHSNTIEMLSYAANKSLVISEEMGYVDQSVFFRIQPNVKYPTWLMSGSAGYISCKALNHFRSFLPMYANFDLFLCVLAKVGMPKGLRAYSEPRLIKKPDYSGISFSKNTNATYSAIGALLGKKWLLIFELQRLMYSRKMNPIQLAKTYLTKSLSYSEIPNLEIDDANQNEAESRLSFDIVIPTLGRKEVLKQTLEDLAVQSLLPKCVIIIEQNSNSDSVSELDYLYTVSWPFEIKHTFTHQTGACNARNLALDQVEADWVFLADDDLRIPNDFLQSANSFIQNEKPQAFTVSCLQQGEVEQEDTVIQWPSFGSGCSFVKASALKSIRFDMALEHGFGEDADFGMQLRKSGVDILYNPFLKLLHLKAPVGGFRKSVDKPWQSENLSPKPAPTVLASILKHATPSQIKGYKTLLFLKFYRLQKNKNPFSYFLHMQKRWKVSLFWAEKLSNTK
ncbi:glycosyltransferase family 2 protein [Leeuwenhoekiella palythoae]|uniref:Glycosyl transferase family 2 n=1 Tax=Leeuwenhoekiella palythoae TaxID=573501 RepID=A0A1M5Z0X2_9FLAO|nr:glycosyltransferase family A protein [Leeuwenhoekiella palythoae]RXG29768.1 glycosyl transferase family 2 [Leeuwenhoekiella palythoae]SHI17932.1 Glycosyl transferase family 2 [Leeuwenhoekiella palythoae]